MTFAKWKYNLKTCLFEFCIIGAVFTALILFFLCRKPTDAEPYDVDELIQRYEAENSVKLWEYRKNLIQSEILEKSPGRDEAWEIVCRIAAEAPKK